MVAKKKTSVRKKAAKKVGKKATKKAVKKAPKKKPAAKKTAKKTQRKKVLAKKSTKKSSQKTTKKAATKKAVKKVAMKKVAKKTSAKKKTSATGKKSSTPKASQKAAKATQTKSPSPESEFVLPRAKEKSTGKEPITLHHREPTKAELKEFRKALADRRLQLSGDVRGLAHDTFSAEPNPTAANDPLESGSQEYAQYFNLQMIEKENSELWEIGHALNKIDGKIPAVYGRCEATGAWISIERLRAKPFARITMRAIEKFEREGGGEDFGIFPDRPY